MDRNSLALGLVLATALAVVVSLVDPLYPREQWLQHSGSLVALVLILIAVRRQWLGFASIVCLLAFLGLHILGARYIYSFVPYDDWSTALCGSKLSQLCGWRRNHYDRLVHFAFGVLAVYPLRETARRYGRMTSAWAGLFALAAVLAISNLYEVFEWDLTLVMSPHQAESYNGQQGDFWDAQKDSALAAAGALGALAVLGICRAAKRWSVM